MVDTANAKGISQINIPSGTFLLKRFIKVYGSGISIRGSGNQTVFVVDNQSGPTLPLGGTAFVVQPTFTNTISLLAAQPTSDTITLRGNVSIDAGERLFLTNGIGSALQLEQRLGGTLTDTTLFRECDSVSFVTVASVSVDQDGNTVIKLKEPLANLSEYFNIAPTGGLGEKFAHIRKFVSVASNLTIADLAIRFKNMRGDVAMYAHYSENLSVLNVSILNAPTDGGPGGFTIVGSTYTTLRNCNMPFSGIGLNSTRFSAVTNCVVKGVFCEEGVTDSLIDQNTFTNSTTVALRTNDMLCARIIFSNNTMNGGGATTGAIGIWEGIDITVSGNSVLNQGLRSIWLNKSARVKVLNNTADSFQDYGHSATTVTSGNSWQR